MYTNIGHKQMKQTSKRNPLKSCIFRENHQNLRNNFKMDWKTKVTTLTEHVIPEVSNEIYDKVLENEVMSNLPLQMGLYFNVVFFPLWIVIIGLLFYDKYFYYSSFTKFVFTTIVVCLIITEILRLYLGYEGNLQDKIPELAGFWMLSVLLQFPMQAFLLFNPNFNLAPLHLVVQATMYTLLCSQIITGYKALRYTSKQQAIYYRIMKLRVKK